MFEPLIKGFDVKQINDFSKAMIKLRKGARSPREKNEALIKQIEYINLLARSNYQFMGKPPKYLFSYKPLLKFTKKETNQLWKALKPFSVRSKKRGLSLMNQLFITLDYLGFARPRVVRNRRGRRGGGNNNAPLRNNNNAPAPAVPPAVPSSSVPRRRRSGGNNNVAPRNISEGNVPDTTVQTTRNISTGNGADISVEATGIPLRKNDLVRIRDRNYEGLMVDEILANGHIILARDGKQLRDPSNHMTPVHFLNDQLIRINPMSRRGMIPRVDDLRIQHYVFGSSANNSSNDNNRRKSVPRAKSVSQQANAGSVAPQINNNNNNNNRATSSELRNRFPNAFVQPRRSISRAPQQRARSASRARSVDPPLRQPPDNEIPSSPDDDDDVLNNDALNNGLPMPTPRSASKLSLPSLNQSFDSRPQHNYFDWGQRKFPQNDVMGLPTIPERRRQKKKVKKGSRNYVFTKPSDHNMYSSDENENSNNNNNYSRKKKKRHSRAKRQKPPERSQSVPKTGKRSQIQIAIDESKKHQSRVTTFQKRLGDSANENVNLD